MQWSRKINRMKKKQQKYFYNKWETIGFMLCVSAAILIYIYLNYSKVLQYGYISLDMDKPLDLFVKRIVDSKMDKNISILKYCEYNIQNIFIMLLNKITGSTVYALNCYFILSFFMIALAVYCLLRKMNISFITSVFFAVLAMLLPFHTDRGQGQIVSSNYFMVPVFFSLIYDIYLNENSVIDEKKLLIISFITPFIDIRIAFMLPVLLVALCLTKVDKESIRHTIIAAVPMIFISLLISTLNKGENMSIGDVLGLASEEGMRILDIVVPVRYHVVGRLMNFRFDYDTVFGANGESGLNSVGFLLSIGFILSIAVLIFGKRNQDKLLEKWIGYINVIVIIVAGVNGLNLLLEYAGFRVLYWDRMAIFTIVGSIIICAKCMDYIRDKLSSKFGQIFSIVFIACIDVISVLDILLRRWMFY